ncbi:hypothetical protein SAMN04489724_0602 [Algoriphagus locisalis]|uniref:Uncharacterized protein n=1 Tax=Algoriphagus locisalis TaxID=305507 RepID=A0A1I6XPY5_9BACT|nr:glycosyltransferase [Algoriphagus locisalis]SFT40256.1 hypothetical protein SAMN04489724_0602 [Algoriphagus locisalis]
MRLLVVAEDLRVSGTSEGQVSRSFVYRLALHPDVEKVDLLYLKKESSDHEIDMLPLNQVWEHDILFSKNKISKFVEKLGHKIFGKSLEDKVKLSKMEKILSNVRFENYDFIAVRSSGQSFLSLRAFKKFDYLKDKIVLFFHDPYPVFWDPGYSGPFSKRSENEFKDMKSLIDLGFKCVTPSNLLSKDLRFLYKSNRNFFTLPHQFAPEVFSVFNGPKLKKESGKITFMYHGAIQLGRKIDYFLDACKDLMVESPDFKDQVKLILRIKGNDVERIKTKYKDMEILQILPQVPSQVAFWEAKEIADINLILEPSGNYSNILVGKAPLLDYVNRGVLVLGPEESELRNLLVDQSSFALAGSLIDIKRAVLSSIQKIRDNNTMYPVFGEYFSVENFNNLASKIFTPNNNSASE